MGGKRPDIELEVLTSTAGIDTFLFPYRFGKPVLEVSRTIIPLQCMLVMGVLSITCAPLRAWPG